MLCFLHSSCMRGTSPTEAENSSSMRCRQGSSRRKSFGMALVPQEAAGQPARRQRIDAHAWLPCHEIAEAVTTSHWLCGHSMVLL